MSLAQASSKDISTTRTSSGSACLASIHWSLLVSIVTGSNLAMARATSAKARCAGLASHLQLSLRSCTFPRSAFLIPSEFRSFFFLRCGFPKPHRPHHPALFVPLPLAWRVESVSRSVAIRHAVDLATTSLSSFRVCLPFDPRLTREDVPFDRITNRVRKVGTLVLRARCPRFPLLPRSPPHVRTPPAFDPWRPCFPPFPRRVRTRKVTLSSLSKPSFRPFSIPRSECACSKVAHRRVRNRGATFGRVSAP